MASTAKSQKDKTYAATPRLLPRPTAASAARAARNATNRNLNLAQRQSPNRALAVSPSAQKGKPLGPRNVMKTESKSDVKICKSPEIVHDTSEHIDVENQPVLAYVVVDNTTVIMGDEIVNHGIESDVHLQDIKESDVFEMKPDDQQKDQLQLQPETSGHISRPQTPTPISRPQTPTPISRPRTPIPVSRPQTPKSPSISSSRPQTPHSRPTTPAHPIRHTTPTSRPATPQPVPTRPATPHAPLPTPVPPNSTVKHEEYNKTNEEDIYTVYTMKQKQFHVMKKELDMKQQAILEVFDGLRALHDRMNREGLTGGGEGPLQELLVFNVGDWTSEEVSQLCRDAARTEDSTAVELIKATVPIDDCALQDLDTKVMNVPEMFAELCLQAFMDRQKLIDWIKELIEINAINDNGSGECMQRIAQYNAEGLQLCEALRELKNQAYDAVDTVTQLSRRACRERSALLAVGESLVREVAKLRQDIETRSVVVNETPKIIADTNISKILEETRRELEEERAAKTVIKDKLATSDSQLRQMRIRISKMDRQLREAEASISGLTTTVKTLEDQSRQKEVQLEARARKLRESLKTGEMTTGHLAQQRDALQNEVADLKAKIEQLNAEHKTAIQELTNQLKSVYADFEEHRKLFQIEVEAKEAAQADLLESQSTIEDLRAKIIELENSRPNPDLPTEREMDLWAELQATKDILRATEDEVTACKREKVRFLETLTKIAGTDNKMGMQQKLAAELLSKEEIMAKMQIQIRELTKNIKLNEQKVVQYEQYVRSLQAHNRAVANCQESPNGISYQDLQQEIMNLKMSLLEAEHRNEELSDVLAQKDQQLEQQDKTSRTQARVIKVREELINMLKNKETEQSRELNALQQNLEHRVKIVEEVNKQIAAKAEEIQELFGTLENKQQQIHRLEKIVLALEEQQRRAQAQRIRHEEKIAALEHELAEGGNRKDRKFLFF